MTQINMRNLALYSAETQRNNFENLKANVSTDIFTDKASDSDINFTTKKSKSWILNITLSERNK